MVAIRRRSDAPAAPRYTNDDVTALSDNNNEPQWLRDARQHAWGVYDETPMPLMEEEWRRTDYRSINWESADVVINANGVSQEAVPAKNREPLVGDKQGGLLIFVDGKVDVLI